MYEAITDPYCYPRTSVLKNIPGLTSQTALDRFEAVATARRFLEPLPAGRLSLTHYHAIHHHIFQDVFTWAGRNRRVRISKGENTFCYPEHIPTELSRIFRSLEAEHFFRRHNAADFAERAAHFLAELNAVHAFRDGNGRTQLAFLTLLSAQAGHPLALVRLEPEAFMQAMIASFRGNEFFLADQIEKLIG